MIPQYLWNDIDRDKEIAGKKSVPEPNDRTRSIGLK